MNSHRHDARRSQAPFHGFEYPVRVIRAAGASEAHHHLEFEFSLALRGRGKYFVQDTAHVLSPGFGLIVPSDVIHYGISDNKDGFARTVLIFSPSVLGQHPAALEALETLKGSVVFRFDSTETANAEMLLKNIEYELSSKHVGWESIVSNQLERFILLVRRAILCGTMRAKPPNPLVQDVISHLQRNYVLKESVEDIARDHCTSPTNLRRIFRRETGLGIKEFIIRVRVDAARKLLEDTDVKIASVAHEVGFQNLSAFNREFKLITGLSPSDYRRTLMG